MPPPRSFRMTMELSGTERPTRHDGTVDVEQTPLLSGEVKLEVDGLALFHVRLRDSTQEEWGQTMDELETAIRRQGLDVPGMSGPADEEGAGDGA
jgi:hypothetical protein